jgi:RHS repeat-associated protein
MIRQTKTSVGAARRGVLSVTAHLSRIGSIGVLLFFLVLALVPSAGASHSMSGEPRAATSPRTSVGARPPRGVVGKKPSIPKRIAPRWARRTSLGGVQRSSVIDAVRVLQGGNQSGAIVDSPGCHQYASAGHFGIDTPLPFWINFLGKGYRHAFVRTDGYIYFDGGIDGDPQPNTVGYPTGAGELQADYTNYRARVIAPFFSFGPPWQPSGAPATSWGETTYNGHAAFCVEWTDEYNQDFCISSFPADFNKTNEFQLLLVERSDAAPGYDNFDIVFNYGSVQWDHSGLDAYDAIRGWKCGDAAGAGWKTGSGDPGTAASVDGSWTYGAFLDSNQTTGLINRSLGDPQLGRFTWSIRNTSQAPHVDPYQTFGPPTNGLSGGAWATNPTASQGEPVNSATGSYYTSTTDLSLPGIGVPFTFVRSYNSGDTTSGPLGPGWTDSLNASLTILPNADVLARSGDGQQLIFTHNPDGTFTPPTGGKSSLTAVAGGFELLSHDQMHFRFDSQGQLTSERDRNNQGLSLTYNADRTLATVVDSVGRTVTLTYTNGLLSQVSLPDGRHVSYGYDPSGHLGTVTDTRGGTTSYTYDAGGRLATIVDQNSHAVIQNTYGGDGRVTQQIDANGGVSKFDWDPTTQTATYTDPRLNTWKDLYQSNVLMDQIDPLGHRTHSDYNDQLDRTAIIDARSYETDMTYDGQGNMLTKVSPLASLNGIRYRETWTYDAFNNIKTYTNRRGYTTTYDYDSAGNLTTETRPNAGDGSPVTLYGRDPGGTGLLTSITDPNQKTTTYGYTNGDLTSITTPLGEKATMTYDSSGRMKTQVDARGNVPGADPSQYTTTFTYDDSDHLLTKTDPLNHPITYTYDPVGNRKSTTDSNTHMTEYGYDAANHLTTVTAPDQTKTTYGYDGNGNLTSRKDANDHTTTFGYDAANQETLQTLPGAQKSTYSYDASGNRITTVDAKGTTTNYHYDRGNRLSNVDFSDGTPSVTYSYDANSNITGASNSASEGYQYDALDRIYNGGQGSNVFSYTYDRVGNVTQRTYPNNVIATYSYDEDERLKDVTTSTGTTRYSYDPAGNLLTTTLPASNGYAETRSYDRSGRLTEVKTQKGSGTLADVVATLDPAGNPLTIVRTGATSLTANFTYDLSDRLTQVCYQVNACTAGSSPFIRWSYDNVGNRLSEARPTATTNYGYDVNDRLMSAGATTYTYDANGNETKAGSATFAYDARNQMKSATVGNTTTTYTYGGDGLRVAASTGPQAAATTNFGWDVVGQLPQLGVEKDGNLNPLRTYLYGLNRIAMTTGGASYYYHYDQMGSVINLTSSTGATQWTESYEPFGTIRTETKNASKAPTNFVKYTGEYLDPTGLYHLRARQLDPASGRFLSPDPVQASRDLPYVAAYAYVNDRPTVATDPTGKCFVLCAVVGAVVNEAVYVAQVASGSQSFSWTGAAEAAGEGFLMGAAGGYGASVGADLLGGVFSSATARAIGAAAGGGLGGIGVTQATSLANGCGFAPYSTTVRGALVGAASAAAGEGLFAQRGFEVRTLRGLVRNQPNTKRIWGGAATTSFAGGGFASRSDPCGLGANGK